MHGYIFAAAEMGLQHFEADGVAIYAGQAPPITLPPPRILHYGLFCRIDALALPHGPWSFNKLSYTASHAGGFNPHACDHCKHRPPHTHTHTHTHTYHPHLAH